MRLQPGALVIGIGLIVTGLWTIASALFPLISGRANLRLVGMQELWPVLLIVAGVAMLVQAIFRKERLPGLIFLGIVALLLGVFFCLFTLKIGNLAWRDLVRLWPFLLLILGFAFLMLYVTDGLGNKALLVPVYVIGGTGIFALPVTLGLARGSSFGQALQLWPLLVIVLALIIFFRPRPIAPRTDSDRRAQAK